MRRLTVWMGADGRVVGTAKPGKPGKRRRPDRACARASRSRAAEVRRPRRGSAWHPANVLRAAELALAPTPELDAMLDSLRDHLGAASGAASFLGGDVDAAAMAAFFRAGVIHRS